MTSYCLILCFSIPTEQEQGKPNFHVSRSHNKNFVKQIYIVCLTDNIFTRFWAFKIPLGCCNQDDIPKSNKSKYNHLLHNLLTEKSRSKEMAVHAHKLLKTNKQNTQQGLQEEPGLAGWNWKKINESSTQGNRHVGCLYNKLS